MNQTITYHRLDLPIGGRPIPCFVFTADQGHRRKEFAPIISQALGPELLPADDNCRGVGLERLPTILKNGCDVEPPNAPFFSGRLDKALEYGCGDDQVIQVFRPGALERSWQEHPANLDPGKRSEVEALYPSVIPSVDGTHLWFTRFPASDTRAAKPYEHEYGRWIPGDPLEALAALVIITTEDSPIREALGLRTQDNAPAGKQNPPNS